MVEVRDRLSSRMIGRPDTSAGEPQAGALTPGDAATAGAQDRVEPSGSAVSQPLSPAPRNARVTSLSVASGDATSRLARSVDAKTCGSSSTTAIRRRTASTGRSRTSTPSSV